MKKHKKMQKSIEIRKAYLVRKDGRIYHSIIFNNKLSSLQKKAIVDWGYILIVFGDNAKMSIETIGDK